MTARLGAALYWHETAWNMLGHLPCGGSAPLMRAGGWLVKWAMNCT